MDEKVLFQYRFADDPAYIKSRKVMPIWAVGLIILGVIYAAMMSGTEGYAVAGFMMGGIFVLCGILVLVIAIIGGKASLTVTPSRVYCRALFSEVSLPMDSITMINKKGLKKFRIESPSENIDFSFYSKNARDDAYDVINRQIAEVKNNKGSVTVVNNNSNADELKKYKDLLDSGIISQEEFDAKKKQLLGL